MANEYTQAEAEAARIKLAAYDQKVAEEARLAREAHLAPIKTLIASDEYAYVLEALEDIGDHYDIELTDENKFGSDANLMGTVSALRQVVNSAKTVIEGVQ